MPMPAEPRRTSPTTASVNGRSRRQVSRRSSAVGLSFVRLEASFTPAVEVAWRLDRRYWGRGYATEAAQASVDDGFRRIGLTAVVAMTTLGNHASIRVMERLGMTRSIEFDHPRYPEGHPLCRHVLYRLASIRPTGRD